MKFFVLLSLSLLLNLHEMHAQSFELLGSQPADGDSSVALQTTVRFSFSAPVDTTMRYSNGWPVNFFAIEPADSIAIDSMYFNESLTELNFDVRHTADTDFAWMLTGAVAEDTTFLCRPYSLNYTTATGYRAVSVSGYIITIVPVSRKAECDNQYFYEAYPFAVLMNGDPQSQGAVVRSVLVNPYEAAFTIRGVREGKYWPAAFLDSDFNGEIEPNWALYPSLMAEASFMDGYYRIGIFPDGIPDSIVVADTALTELELLFAGPGSRETVTRVSDLFELGRPYPNPARTAVSLPFRLTADTGHPVRIQVYDIIGRRIATLLDARLSPGFHEVRWAVSDDVYRAVPAGVYFFRFNIGEFVAVRSVIVR